MVRRVIVDGVSLEVESFGDGRLRVVDSTERVSLAIASSGRLSLLLGDRSYVVRREGEHIFIGPRRLHVTVVDPRAFSRGARHGPSESKQALTAPMPGRVVRILKSAGAPVEPGDGIVVVEAMKMQNELKAARTGVVTSVTVVEGDAVAAGQVLATIEQEG